MDQTADDFLKRLLATFKLEATEHVKSLSSGLMGLEKAGAPEERQAVVETVFREAHSLKGAARAVGKRDIETLCQSAESVFSELKRGDLELTPPLLDLLHETADLLDTLLQSIDGEPAAPERDRVEALCSRLAAAAEGEPLEAPGPPPGPAEAPPPEAAAEPEMQAAGAVIPEPAGPPLVPLQAAPAVPAAAAAVEERSHETIRIPVTRLDSVLFQAEAMVVAKLAAHQRAADLRQAARDFAALKKERSRATAEVKAVQRTLERGNGQAKPDPTVRKLVDYLVWEDDFIKSFEGRLRQLAKDAEQGWRGLGSTVDGLLEDVKKALMLPLASVTEVLPKLVRDLSREQGKEVEFQASGMETEIDRRILEEIRDPVLHLVRNCLDHGIETPAARQAAGKPRRGSIVFAASEIEGGRIEIRVEDDGGGIDLSRVQAAAAKAGLPAGPEGDNEALLSLIFQSGISTSPLITDISGRGLGLAIVREKVERLGGTVAVETRPGQGTAFRIVLPLTLATFRGVRVRAGEQEFIFPTMQLSQVTRVKPGEVKTVENRETILLGGRTVAMTRLTDVLGVAAPVARTEGHESITVAVAGSGERRVAFRVDEVVGEQEVLMKSLGRQLARVRNVAGAAVLGAGKVVPVLHVPDLLKSARRVGAGPVAKAAAAARKRASILVAEDSITSRMLLKSILESAGFQVSTAVDGVDAYTQLKSDTFDLLVSDVDMPRMSGFDLTAKVRADRKLAELPVVLVTSLASPESKERGAEAGADAYIVKSSFDQSNLLAAIRRLL